ncbi:MAG TPA: methyltransferase [Streptosporangiaceae bacterium]|nr:methyltransferase [Streptosporangiaceae bacterium]
MTYASTVAGADPADIKRLGNGFCHAKLLLTASELGLFASLADTGPATGPQIQERLGLHPRGCRDFLSALVLLGLLTRDGDRYSNSAVASEHLVPGGTTYLGGFLERSSRVLYPAWGSLGDALRTGLPQVPAAQSDAFERMLKDPRQLGQYLGMMDSVNGLLAPELARAFDWSGRHTVVDVGGARGNLAAQLIIAHPHLSAWVFDLPVMEAPLREHVTSLVGPDRVRFRGGDFFSDPLPEGDVLILGHVLHNWSPEERQLLVKKAYAATRPGGALLVYDAMLEDDPADIARVLVSLNMLLVTPNGSEYPVSECRGWLAGAGFEAIGDCALGPADTLVIGHKGPE